MYLKGYYIYLKCLKIHDPKVHVARAPDTQNNTPRIYSNKNLSFINKNLRYGLEFMSGVVVKGNREKQAFILAKVGFVSNRNGSEKLRYGFRFSMTGLLYQRVGGFCFTPLRASHADDIGWIICYIGWILV
jgi:hypothetical protein